MANGEDKRVVVFIPGHGYYRVREEQVPRLQQLIRLAAQDPETQADTLEIAAFRALQDQTGTGVSKLMREFEHPPSGTSIAQPGERIIRFDKTGESTEEIAQDAISLDQEALQEKSKETDEERGRRISRQFSEASVGTTQETPDDREEPLGRPAPVPGEDPSTEVDLAIPGRAASVPTTPEIAEGINAQTQETPGRLSLSEVDSIFAADAPPIRPIGLTEPQLQRVSSEVAEATGEEQFAVAGALVGMEQQQRSLERAEETFGNAFGRGVEQAIRRPLQIFGVEADVNLPEIREGVSIYRDNLAGEVSGELLGSLGAFVGSFGVVGLGLRGVGLAAQLTPLSTLMTQSAMAGALLGAGSTPPEEMDKLGVNMMKEAVLWAAGDAAVLGLFGKMGKLVAEGRKIKGVTRQVRGQAAKPKDITVEPIYVNLDRALHPNGAGTTREAVDRIIALAESGGDNPYGAAAGILALRSERQFGYAVLEAASKQEADEMLAGLKSVGDDVLQFARHKNQVIAVNESGAPGIQVRRDATTGKVSIIRREGLTPGAAALSEKSTPQEIIDAVRAGVANDGTAVPLEIEVIDAARSAGRYEYTIGDKGILRRKITITIAPDADDAEILSVLAHEAAHDMMIMALRETPDRVGLVKSLLGGGEAMRTELREVVVENIMRREGIGRRAARRRLVSGEELTDEFEMMANLVELMSLDPGKAFLLAPNAFKATAKFVMENSPLVRALITGDRLVYNQSLAQYLKVMEGKLGKNPGKWGVKKSFSNRWREVTTEQQKITPKLLAQFEREGGFEGMSVWYNGVRHEYVRSLGKGKVLIRETRITRPVKGQAKIHRTVDANKIQRATFENMLKLEGDVKRLVDEVVRRGLPEIVGISAREGARQVRMIFRTRDFVRLKGEGIEAVESWLKKKRPDITIEEGTREEILAKAIQAAKDEGARGLMINDHGSLRIYTTNPRESSALHFFDEAPSNTKLPDVDGGVYEVTPGDLVAQSLYQRGVDLTDAKYLAGLVEEGQLARLLREIDVGGEFTLGYQAMLENWNDFMQKLDFLNVGGKENAVRAGMLYDQMPDGSVVLRVDPYGLGQPGGTPIAHFDDIADAQSYVAKLDPGQQPQNFTNIPGLSPELARGLQAVGGAAPPKVGQMADDLAMDARASNRAIDQLLEWRNQPSQFVDDALTNFPTKLLDIKDRVFQFLTAMKPIAQAYERDGFGPAFTVIYRKTQDAMETVKRSITDQTVFNGKSYADRLGDLRHRLLKLSPQRRGLITQLNMAISRDEVLQGTQIFGREINDIERKLIGALDQAGIGQDVPMIVSQFHKLRDLARQGGDLLDAAKAEVQGLETINRSFNLKLMGMDREGYTAMSELEKILTLADLHGVPEAHRTVLGIIHRATAGKDVDVNFMAVSRYFSVDKGMSRDAFIRKFNLTSEEIALADEMIDIMTPAFGSRDQVQRFMKGVFPEASRWIENKMVLDERIMGSYFDTDGFFMHSGMERGDISAFITDPVQLAYRAVRSKKMQQHWDPVFDREVKPALDAMGNVAKQTGDPTAAKARDNMIAYVNELKGVPHGQFKQLDIAAQQLFKTMGITNVPPEVVSDLTRKMMMLTYKAFIPFRPLLLIRNLFEVSRLGGVVGGKDLGYGIRYVMQNRKAAFEEAVKAGAIKPDLPVFPVDNAGIMGFGTYGSTTRPLLDKALRGSQRMANKINDISEIGMGYYQKVDDMSRAIAFHAMKRRVTKHMDLAQTDFAKFKAKAKINTMDDTEIAEFTRIWQQNQMEAVDYIARQFSDNSMFLYGNANHPLHWNSVAGVIFGQFGTWPVQYAQWMARGATRGSYTDRAQFMAWNIGMFWGMVEAGDEVGLDFRSYWGMSSFPYTGGPWAGIVTDAMQAVGGNQAEKALARASLKRQLDPTNFPSPYVPLSAAVNDTYDAIVNYDNPIKGALHEFVVPQTRDQDQ